ncbi:unnamed protein product [Durusdinium trenchii]|uniref:Uncharacterized protein n=1 Tax=Durusdinium trenchii TaxID=1381693 RepID=A0ABP0P3D5_9DINO
MVLVGHVLNAWQPLTGKQLRAFFFCWLTLSSHVLGSPLATGGAGRIKGDGEPHENAVFAAPGRGLSSKLIAETFEASTKEAGSAGRTVGDPEDGRQLQSLAPPYSFFTTPPYVNVVVFDSHDPNCDVNFESPPVTDPTKVGYPADGTDSLRQAHMACGVAPARFVFTTSDLEAYADPTVAAKMQIRITCAQAFFVESPTCENVLDAIGNFPRIEECRFNEHEARLILQTRLLKQTTYSLTMKLLMPAGRMTAAENSYVFTTEYDPDTVIEGTESAIDLGYTVPHAKDPVYGNDFSQRGYITGFFWQPTLTYTSTPDVVTVFTFGLRTFGTMNTDYNIDIIAHPTNVWKMGTPGTDCEQFTPPHIGTTCRLQSFQGALASEANGFRLDVGTTPMENLGSQSTPQFSLVIKNPPTSVNMYWTATSFRIDEDQLPQEPFTVFLDKPVNVMGTPFGQIASYERGDVDVEQWVVLEFTPGNTIMPGQTMSGVIVILPPSSFTIVASAAPQLPSSEYNELPCTSWPEADRLAGRWVCPIADTAPFKDTIYGVRLKVKNPAEPGAARSWRIELWEEDAAKPVAATRGIRGMEVSGPMQAALSQENQLLGSINTVRFDIIPQQPIGNVPNTRLRVLAPPGFVIIKRCLGFQRIELPVCNCIGSDSNSFELVFSEPGAILGGVQYSFQLQLQNPVDNIADSENVWSFDTLRPDGVARDTARSQGFFLYPYEFSSFVVVPLMRKPGPQTIVVRFISPLLIPFDDYIRVRAPVGVAWHIADLQFSTQGELTQANELGAKEPSVEYETPNELVVQLTTTAQANFEYGIAARAEIPQATPVPNAWWIEQYRRTGNPPPDSWRYIASKGTTGFKTQVLVNTRVEPFNVVAEGWQNPTLFVFETTMEVMPFLQATASGTELVPAVLLVEAPPGFTYICPLTTTVYMPAYTIDLPVDTTCSVDHNNLAERNKLYLQIPDGLQGDTRYAFTIDVVNAKLVDPLKNVFRLATMLNGEVVEEATTAGFQLAQRMDNTRYEYYPVREDRRVEASQNIVTFIIGTTKSVSVPSVLEIRAPIGFRFLDACDGQVGWATWVALMLPFPAFGLCQGMGAASADMQHVAQLQVTGNWELGNYGLFVTVMNPMFTPERNFWGFTIFARDTMMPEMSESWVYGFQIQVVLNPMLKAYNQGNGVDGEAAINHVDISFELSTRMPPQPNAAHAIVVTAPQGFFFPSICQSFTLDTFTPGFVGFPKGTGCQGNNGNILKIALPFMRELQNATAYMFRALVVNPRETFTDVTSPDKYWRIESQYADGTMVDLNRVIPSFPILSRLRYFAVNTLSQVGLAPTTYRIHFRTDESLPPQQTVHIRPPAGTTFGGLTNGECINTDPVLLSLQFPTPLISGVTRLPEWVSCQVVSPTELMLRNEEPILGGRPLIAGPVFEFFIMNATNAESTPLLNLFQIEAMTSTLLGKEVWTAPGWVIYPELTLTSVQTANPGYGLYTNFTIMLQTITEVPSGGSIRIIAPDDYYFGPVIETAATRYDPLVSEPSPQGAGQERPSPNKVTICHILRTENWACALEFEPCVIMDELDELITLGMVLSPSQETARVGNRTICLDLRSKCDVGGQLSDLLSCRSQGSTLDLFIAPTVYLPARRLFQFLIQGYNARNAPANASVNTWHFMTRNSDSENTILDEKPQVQGVSLIGIVLVDSIVPSNTKVSSIENYVTVTLRLTTPCDPRAILRISFPSEYMRGENAAFSGPAIQTGYTFPQQVERRQSLNVVELEAIEEGYPANVPLVIILGLSNPEISPTRQRNVWTFEALSLSSGSEVLLNVNLNVTGFKIFGEFSGAYVTGTVLSPLAQNVVGIWFNLKSPLKASLETGQTSQMRLWLPPTFQPLPDCGTALNLFSLSYDVGRELVKNPFPTTISYLSLPSGTYCFDGYDEASGQWYVEMTIEQEVSYGLDYAFEFALTNPFRTPATSDNVWRFETLQNGVILHLRRSVPGFELEQIKEVRVTPSDTTTLLALHRLEFYIMSDKYIPGGSKIEITAPNGFIFTCAFFSTDDGLANTTTCYVRELNIAEFTMDTSDPLQPNSPFRLFVFVSNPEFTPQQNYWNFRIISPLAKTLDMRDYVQSFDITGRLEVDIQATFPYFGQINPLRIVFTQSTILNQADIGNELVLSGPDGFIFPTNCTGFRLRWSNQVDAPTSTRGYDIGFVFPPEGMTCRGYDNASVVVRFPNGAGLLRNNYTLEIDVSNPGYPPNATQWSFITRIRNDFEDERIADANRTLLGFELVELLPMRTDEGAARPGALALLPLALLWYVLLEQI